MELSSLKSLKNTIFINLKAINHMGQFWIKDNFSPDIT